MKFQISQAFVDDGGINGFAHTWHGLAYTCIYSWPDFYGNVLITISNI